MPEHDPKTCPNCEQTFTPKRSNQTFCSRPCQKSSSQNTARGDRKAEYEARKEQHYERAKRLKEMIYSTAPAERLGAMKHILDFIPNDAGLRNILTDPRLLSEPPHVSGRMNIAKAANAYTRKFFGCSIKPYVQQVKAGEAPEPIEVVPEPNLKPPPKPYLQASVSLTLPAKILATRRHTPRHAAHCADVEGGSPITQHQPQQAA